MSTFDSTKTRLADLLKGIEVGEIQLPDFQRGWVWDDEHIRSLLTSIARAFPVGAIMLLETGGEARFKVRPVEGLDPVAVPPENAEQLILDGQQRLTSLTQVLSLNQPVKTRDEKKRPMERYYYIDIETALEGPEHYEEAIVGVDADKTQRTNFGRDITLDLRTSEKEYENFYFPCNQILNSDTWEEGLNAFDATKFSRYMQFRKDVLSEFRNYDIPVIELKKDNKKEAVCLVFEKVNTGGVPLSVFELITATYAADGVNLRDEWYGNKKDDIEGTSRWLGRQRLLKDIQPTDFFQGLSLLRTYELRKEDIANGKTGKQITGVSAKRESVLALPLSAYERLKDPLAQGFWKAAKFLRKESFFSKRDLPYRTQIVPLAAVLAMLEDRWLEQRIYDRLAQWFWCGVLGELYDSLKQGEAFKVRETATESLKASVHSAVKYDLIGKLAEETQLTRNTIAGILQGINVAVFSQYKTNPEDFIAKAARLINEQKATVIVEHLAYDPVDETHSSDIFTQEKPKEDFSKAMKTDRHIYDYVFTDSKNERTFVKELDTSTEVVVYAKLPKSFFIPTPVGNYNPDWAIAFEDGKVKHVYFIAETKGSMSSMELRKIEECKIDCARKFFTKITSDQVKYDVVDSYGKLMELVK